MNVSKQLRQAQKLISYGRLKEAINIYQEILAEDFQNLEVHGLIADVYVAKQDTLRASRHLFKIAAEYGAQGYLSEAISVYHKIIAILPRNALAREKLLEIYSRKGSKQEILSLVSELCAIYESEGNSQKVIECLEKLTSLEPSNKNHRLKLALLFGGVGLKEKATNLLYEVAKEYLKEDRFDDALTTLERVRTIDPKDESIPLKLAQVHEKRGNLQAAIESLVSGLREDSTQPEALADLARLCAKAGRMEEAERIYQKLVQMDPGSLGKSLPFVEALIAGGKTGVAVKHIVTVFREVFDNQTRSRCAELLEEILKLDPQELAAYEILETFYREAFDYNQLAVTLLSHADAYLAKFDTGKALELVRQLAELDPFNQEYQAKLKTVEKLHSSGKSQSSNNQADVLPAQAMVNDEPDPPQDDLTVSSKVAIFSEDDIEAVIIDVELLEKFGQHGNGIRRLEEVLKSYPHEIKLRKKLKSLYVGCNLKTKAAQECLEIAKLLQQRDQNDEAGKYLREAQRLNPRLSTTGRASSGSVTSTSQPAEKQQYSALRGDLAEIGLLDVIQILENSQKSGQLNINSEGQKGVIFFNSGKMVNAGYLSKKSEQAIFALVGVNGGSFEYQPSTTPFEVVIQNSNTNLLLEGLRLLDEANRDLAEAPNSEAPSTQPAEPSPEPVSQASVRADEADPLEGL